MSQVKGQGHRTGFADFSLLRDKAGKKACAMKRCT